MESSSQTQCTFYHNDDSLVMACGGLLPFWQQQPLKFCVVIVFRFVESTFQSELCIDSAQQELRMEDAVQFLRRFAELTDVFVFASGSNFQFQELEHERYSDCSDSIHCQECRTCRVEAFYVDAKAHRHDGVRNILACRLMAKEHAFTEISLNCRPKYDAILRFTAVRWSNARRWDVERLLQTIDIKRLRRLCTRHGQLHSGLNILRNNRFSGRESAGTIPRTLRSICSRC